MNENPYYSDMNEPAVPVKKTSSGLSVAAFILSLISIFLCFFFVNIIFAFISIILAVIAIAKKYEGKGLSISAIIISSFSIGITTLLLILIMPIISVMSDLADDIAGLRTEGNYEAVIEEYERTGVLPEEFEKYSEGESGEFFDKYCGGFDNFFDIFIRIEK